MRRRRGGKDGDGMNMGAMKTQMARGLRKIRRGAEAAIIACLRVVLLPLKLLDGKKGAQQKDSPYTRALWLGTMAAGLLLDALGGAVCHPIQTLGTLRDVLVVLPVLASVGLRTLMGKRGAQ